MSETTKQVATRPADTSESRAVANKDLATAVERLVILGDLSQLTPVDRVTYYKELCHSIGVDWIARPFDYLTLDGKLTLYANQNCAAQLRDARHVSVKILGREEVGDVYIVTALASLPGGRCEEATGVVSMVEEQGEWKTAQQSGKKYFAGNGEYVQLRGKDLANLYMKAETKAKRRATFALCGLGAFADEPEGQSVDINTRTGELNAPDPHEQAYPAEQEERFDPRQRTAPPKPPMQAQARVEHANETVTEEEIQALGTAIPGEIAAPLMKLWNTCAKGEELPWNDDAKRRAAPGRACMDRLKLHGYTPAESAALFRALHFASTGENVPSLEAGTVVSARVLVALQELPSPEIEALLPAARWFLGREGS